MGYYRANVGKGTRKMKARPLFQLSVGWLLKWLVVDGFRRDVSRARRELRAVRTPKIVLRNFYEVERYSSVNFDANLGSRAVASMLVHFHARAAR